MFEIKSIDGRFITCPDETLIFDNLECPTCAGFKPWIKM